jgi:hypothetical protein
MVDVGYNGTSQPKLRDTIAQFSARLERAELLLDESAKGAAVLPQILNELSRLRVELVSAATKSEHVPISALVSVSRIYNGVLKSLCFVMVALVVWLTGAKALLTNLETRESVDKAFTESSVN